MSEYVGGLVGGSTGKVTGSSWDTQTSISGTGAGDGDSTGIEGKTAAELQAPTGYTGIHSAWARAERLSGLRHRQPVSGSKG